MVFCAALPRSRRIASPAGIVFPASICWLPAAPEALLGFLFYGSVIVLPVIAAYTVHVYWVFRGKVHAGYG